MKHNTNNKKYLLLFFTLAIITALSFLALSCNSLYGSEKPGTVNDGEAIEAPQPDPCASLSPSPSVINDSPEKTTKKIKKPKKAKYPRLLLYSFIHPDYLKDTAEFWGTKTGFTGFMISYVCDWDVPEEKIHARIARLREMNEECAKYGIDSNFIKLSMGHLKELNWTDNEEWKKVTDRVCLAASVAKETGFVGIVLDTEPYNWRENSIWDYKNPLYEAKTKGEMESLVRLRGYQLMTALKEGFPESEFIMFPEGYFYFRYPAESVNDTAKIYNLWQPFFQGLCDAGLEKGIVVGTERTYHITKPSSIKKKVQAIEKTMQEAPSDPHYWRKKCSLALGSAPLGKTFQDKRSRFSLKNFKNQMKTFAELSPRYVWIYGHGAAWWQIPVKDEKKYQGTGFSYWRPNYQILKCDKYIKDFYDTTWQVFRK